MDVELPDELRPVGPGRYEGWLSLPWGQRVAAEILIAARGGWSQRPEASDAAWTALAVGPAVVAVRLRGGLPRPAPPVRRVREPATVGGRGPGARRLVPRSGG